MPDDTDLFSFDEPASLQAYMDAVRAVARDASDLPTAQAADRVRGLALAEVLPALPQHEARALLFHVAREMGCAEPAAGWAGLHDAASVLIADTASPVAWRVRSEGEPRASRWVLPLPAPIGAGIIHAIDAETAHCYVSPVAEPAAQALWASGSPLQALGGRLCMFDTPAFDGEARELSQQAWLEFTEAQTSALAGLLVGACDCAVREAVAYAHQRISAGKPIAHHQAVALRLAEMTMNHAALCLQFNVTSVHGSWSRSPDVLAIGAESACAIARDALQTAAAHGYVAGLPFRRLHEQVYSLSCLLNAWRPCLEPAPQTELT